MSRLPDKGLNLTWENEVLELGLKQADVARAIGSSQSRVAKMEAADPSVSMDLLVRTLLRLGGSPETVASLVSGDSRRKAAI